MLGQHQYSRPKQPRYRSADVPRYRSARSRGGMPQITMIKPKRKAFRLFGVSGIMTISFFALVVWRAISLTSQTSNLVAMVGIYPDHHAVDMHVREKDELSGKGPLGCRTLVSRLRFFPVSSLEVWPFDCEKRPHPCAKSIPQSMPVFNLRQSRHWKQRLHRPPTTQQTPKSHCCQSPVPSESQ
jgi:hypothetical protein